MAHDRAVTPPALPLLIGGRLIPPSGDPLVVTNPADGTIAGTAAVADEQLVDEAVGAAAEAFPAWADTPVPARAALLAALAGWLRAHRDIVATLLTAEQGKPISEARSEVDAAAAAFDYYAGAAGHVLGEIIPTASRTLRSHVLRQPVGVVAAITTFNYPLGLMAWKVAPALAAGCTVVAKPDSRTPLATLMLGSAARDAGLPPGVVNLIAGDADVGARLTSHPQVRHITFTGGTATGKILLHTAAESITRTTLELGGGSPQLVAADAPLEKAVADGVKRAFRNAGQLCNSVQQVLVHASIAQDFTARFVAATETLRVGRGDDDPEPDMGPLTDAAGLSRVESGIADARAKGARVLTGGSRSTDGPLAAGFFHAPTVLTDVTEEMSVTQEEIFGPAVVIRPVSTMDEAIEIANSGDSGLVAYLYTRDLQLATRGAERLEYGTVNVNNVGGGDVPFPYAGWKHSGLGVELARAGLEAFLEIKHVRIDIGY